MLKNPLELVSAYAMLLEKYVRQWVIDASLVFAAFMEVDSKYAVKLDESTETPTS